MAAPQRNAERGAQGDYLDRHRGSGREADQRLAGHGQREKPVQNEQADQYCSGAAANSAIPHDRHYATPPPQRSISARRNGKVMIAHKSAQANTLVDSDLVADLQPCRSALAARQFRPD
jgi:hypothetical protein